MALTRKMLEAMGIENEKIDQIIEMHVESIDGLKAERDRYKEGADKAEGLRKQLDEAKKAGEGADEYEEKYKAKCKELDDYKAKVDGEAAEREKRGLYRELLAGAGVDPKRIDTVLKVSDLSGVTVKDGAIEGADDLTESIKSDFIAVKTTQGATVPNPPKSTGGAAAPKNLREALHQRYENKE
uniref:phage scaffolding protein n=1 Tax=Collinsella aerofaciens TaxID=74426 RepID=UPI00359C438B